MWQGDFMNKKKQYIINEIKKYFNEFKLGTKKMFKEFFKKDTNKKQRANMWSFTRLIIPIITLISSTIAIIVSSPILFGITGAIAGFGAITDYFDGKSSRKHESSSEYGKILDQVTDKFFAGIIGFNLLFLNFNYIYILIGELVIAAINIRYKLKDTDLNIPSSRIGKIKEWPLFATLALGFLSPINSILLTISNLSIILTAIFQILTAKSYVVNNNKELKVINEYCNISSDIENDENKDKEIICSNFSKKSKLEQYQKLRDVLNNIKELKEKEKNNIETSLETNINEKQKKLV